MGGLVESEIPNALLYAPVLLPTACQLEPFHRQR
jgi:hypothetical protein